jgi:(p)ppGpp synthase/HD superfamily hydrolase
MKNLSKAISIAAKSFENTLDKGGNPYILHCLYVMNQVAHLGETAMICGVLHDLVEDFPDVWDYKRLMNEEGFHPEVINILMLLTHNKSTDYMTYIQNISHHPIAREIKKADLRHNSDITRLKGIRKKDFDRLQKYSIAYQYLSE